MRAPLSGPAFCGLLAAATTALALTQIARNRTPDFAQDYAAAWAYWHGHPVHAPTGELLRRCWPDHGFSRLDGVQQPHPPFATLLALPLALLPFPTARLVWCCLSGAAIAAGWQSARASRSVCLASVPIWCVALVLGTHEPVLFALIAAAALGLPARPRMAGLCLGLSIALKAYPAVLLVGLVLTRNRRCLSAALCSAAAAAIAAELVLGWGTTVQWLAYTRVNTATYLHDSQNGSMVRHVHRLIPLPPAAIAAGLAVLLVAPLARKLKADDPLRPLLPVALLASPLSWRHYMGLTSLLPLDIPERLCLVLAGGLTLLFGIGWIAAPPELFVQLPLVGLLLVQWARCSLARPPAGDR